MRCRAPRVVFVGEQPGDQEDRQGEPFVGPAGALLDKALGDAGIPRDQVYVTNAVKHFKWESRGKRRIHKKPRISEIKACRPWLEAELRAVKPDIVVVGLTVYHDVVIAGRPLPWAHRVSVTGRRCSLRTTSGGKYTLPSTISTRSSVASANTTPFQIALGILLSLPRPSASVTFRGERQGAHHAGTRLDSAS